MAKIENTDINNSNLSIYSYATKAKVQSSLPSSLQSSTGNNVSEGSKITPVNIENIKNAIKILEKNFSNNCCQSNCNSTSTKCQTVLCQNVTGMSTSQCYTPCQTCQYTYSLYRQYYDNCTD